MPDEALAPVILCAGSLHHDVIVEAPGLPRVDQTLTGTGVRTAFGGKGGNQAAAAARAGARVHMAGAVGSDEAAMMLRTALDAAGVRRECACFGCFREATAVCEG